jgi:hypothetical protein
MKFFLPIRRDVAWERETYTLLKRLLSAALATSFTERQICSLHYQAEGQASDVDVGQPYPLNGEIIIAILEGTSPPPLLRVHAHAGGLPRPAHPHRRPGRALRHRV